jgi:hypothetical protein
MANEFVAEIGFDAPAGTLKGGKISTYKGSVKDHKDRIAILSRQKKADGTLDMDKIKFVVVNTHYIEGGGFIVCTNGLCCEKAGAPKSRIGVIIAKYPTNKNGEVDGSRIMTDTEVMPWILNSEKFEDLKGRNKNRPIALNDIEVKHGELKYQNMSFDITPEGIWLLPKLEALKVKLLKQTAELELSLPNLLGRKVTPEELRTILAVDSGEPAAPVASSIDYTNVLSNL